MVLQTFETGGDPANAPTPKRWLVDTEGSEMVVRALLERSASQLADFLDEIDTDRSGTIDRKEFVRAFNSMLGNEEGRWATDKKGAGKLFDEFDRDGSGTLEIKELRCMQRDSSSKKRAEHARAKNLPSFTLDLESNISVTAQLRNYLRSHRSRVLDLFKEWCNRSSLDLWSTSALCFALPAALLHVPLMNASPVRSRLAPAGTRMAT
jgi:Ca2+-binding EF-hand superfamily protein